MGIFSGILSLLAGPMGAPLGELAIAILGAILGKGQENAQARGDFLNMIKSMESAGCLPAGLHDKYAAQSKSLDSAIDAELAKEKQNGKV